MSDYLKKNISRYKGDIEDRLTKLLRDAYGDLPLKIKDEDYLPSASACWVQLDGDKAKICVLGDCEVTAITCSGEIVRYFDGALNVLDRRACNEMTELAKQKNLRIRDARKLIQETLIRHRKLANKPDGYAALTLSPNAEIKGKRFETELKNIKTLYLYSDGFSQAFENLKIYPSHEEMFRQMQDVDEEIKKIVKASYADAECERFPRFKVIDDITVTKIDL